MLNDDGYKDLKCFHFYFVYSPKEKWIGIRNWRQPQTKEQGWNDRIGKKQLYLLQLIPCLGIAFEVTYWTSTKKEVKKKK